MLTGQGIRNRGCRRRNLKASLGCNYLNTATSILKIFAFALVGTLFALLIASLLLRRELLRSKVTKTETSFSTLEINSSSDFDQPNKKINSNTPPQLIHVKRGVVTTIAFTNESVSYSGIRVGGSQTLLFQILVRRYENACRETNAKTPANNCLVMNSRRKLASKREEVSAEESGAPFYMIKLFGNSNDRARVFRVVIWDNYVPS